MFKKTLIAEFFTTISFKQSIQSLSFLTFKLPFLRYWKYNKIFEKKILEKIWNKESKNISFYNWRSAIYHALKIIWVSNFDEVIVSWYTCISVSNAVIQSWAKIIYSDIEKDTLWLNLDELEKNITSKTKVIIVQHTFWKPSKIKKIQELATKNNIIIIEDCAHSLWSNIEWKQLWNFWDFSIFSTWRDKVISSVTWWLLIINNKKYFHKINEVNEILKLPSRTLTIRNLMYNSIAYKSYKNYDFLKLWRLNIYIARKLKIITEILTKDEKECNYKNFNYNLPNSLAYLALQQIEKLEKLQKNRLLISEYYNKNINNNSSIEILFKTNNDEINNYFRYPILLKSEKIKNILYNYMRNNDVILGNTWSWINIVPMWSNLTNAKYILWSCPIAENISKRILTLPNHKIISIKDVERIVKLVNNFKK